jgi:hypothetical protein
MQNTWYGWWTYWNLYHKVTFDGTNKIILINYGELDVDVKQDIYSAWKEWAEVDDNLKFLAALRAVGGDPTVGSSYLGSTFFLINDWRIRTWEGDQNLTINGNLFVDGGGNPFLSTLEPHNILITTQRSNLVDLLVVSASSGGSGSFTDSDRTALNTINTIVTNLPESGSLTTIQTSLTNIESATFLRAGTIIAPGTNAVLTDISDPSQLYDNMFAIITSGSYSVSRKIVTQITGVFDFDNDLPFTAISGSGLTIVPGYNPVNGRIG